MNKRSDRQNDRRVNARSRLEDQLRRGTKFVDDNHQKRIKKLSMDDRERITKEIETLDRRIRL